MGESIFSRYDRQVWVLVAGSFINSFGFSIAYPFISLYLYKYMGIPMSSVGFALMFAAIVGGIAQIIGGELCDRFGRKIMMNIGLLFQSISFGLLALAVTMHLSFFSFLAILTLREAAGGLYRNVPMVMVADVASVGDRNGAFSLLRIGGNLGFAIGPVLGGVFAMYSYSIMFMATAITSGLYMLISLFLLRDTLPGIGTGVKPGDISPWHDKLFLLYCGISAVVSVVYAQMLTTYGTYSGSFVHIPESHIGLLFSLNGFMVVFFQYPVAIYIERFKLTTSLAAGAMLYAIGFGMVGFCNGFWQLFLAMFIISMGELIFTPPSMTIVSQMASIEARGRYMSLSGVFGNAGFAFGPMIGGYLMDVYSSHIETAWLIMGALAFSCVPWFMLLRKRLRPEIDMAASA